MDPQSEQGLVREAAIGCLKSEQKENGGFFSSSAASNDFHDAIIRQTTFFTSIILGCLIPNEDQRIDEVIEKGTNFLLQEKSNEWTFNYWSKQSAEYTLLPYPEDLDDTFCALGALHQTRPKILTGAVLAKVTQILVKTEQKPGGPYRTWLAPNSLGPKWQDIDSAVNSNVAWFLSRQGVELPNLVTYIEQKIQAKDLSSPYYPTIYPTAYYISRWYKGDLRAALMDLVVRVWKNDQANHNILTTALIIIVLINLQAPMHILSPLIDDMMTAYHKTGWRPYPFCLDPALKGKQYMAGSSALTAAFTLQALRLYQEQKVKAAQVNPPDPEEEILHVEIVRGIEKRLKQAGMNVSIQGTPFLQSVLEKDKNRQITLLPWRFAHGLATSTNPIPQDLLYRLGLASLCGWVGYTIYDQVIDESKAVSLIPVAQVCIRELTSIYHQLALQYESVLPLFKKIMDDIDEANIWEIQNARALPNSIDDAIEKARTIDYGDLGQLARRSMGHALGPLVVLMHRGYGPGSTQFEALYQFFYHYLIARQLNDDAHDWEEDLERGQINSVAVWLLHGQDQSDLQTLRSQFWHDTIHIVNQNIRKHVSASRDAIKRGGIIGLKTCAERLLRPLEAAVHMAETETKTTEEFLAEYKKLV